jgi:hypothetical protein
MSANNFVSNRAFCGETLTEAKEKRIIETAAECQGPSSSSRFTSRSSKLSVRNLTLPTAYPLLSISFVSVNSVGGAYKKGGGGGGGECPIF